MLQAVPRCTSWRPDGMCRCQSIKISCSSFKCSREAAWFCQDYVGSPESTTHIEARLLAGSHAFYNRCARSQWWPGSSAIAWLFRSQLLSQ